MEFKSIKDEFLEKRLAVYDQWLEKDLLSYTSKVVPIVESFSPEQWVLPTAQALKLLGDAASLAVQPCECRSHYKRCDNPLEVCLLMDQVADRLVEKKEARYVSLDEAAAILKQANRCGLVHLSLYRPDHRLFALCSCCSCCCHDLQLVKKYGRKDLMVKSEYRAVTRTEDCMLCGACVDRCLFDARHLTEEGLLFEADKCLGCGLCVTVCPANAVSMKETRKAEHFDDDSQ